MGENILFVENACSKYGQNYPFRIMCFSMDGWDLETFKFYEVFYDNSFVFGKTVVVVVVVVVVG